MERVNTITRLIHYSGPGFLISDFESNHIIGNLQFQGAQKIMNGQLAPVSGTVKSVHAYMDMWASSSLMEFLSTVLIHLTDV